MQVNLLPHLHAHDFVLQVECRAVFLADSWQDDLNNLVFQVAASVLAGHASCLSS